eukprot:631785_1
MRVVDNSQFRDRQMSLYPSNYNEYIHTTQNEALIAAKQLAKTALLKMIPPNQECYNTLKYHINEIIPNAAFQVYHPKIAPFKTQTIRHHNLKICYLNIDGNAKKKKAPERNNTIPGYEPYHFSAAQENNNKRSIGGIMIFTRLELKAPMIITKDYNDCDLVWMRMNNTMYAIGYCRPGNKQYNIKRIDSFFNHLDEDIQEYKDRNNVKNIVLIGDFNARCGNQTGDKKLNSNGKDLIALLQKHELKILNNKYNYGTPTFTTSKNGTSCIDFGLTNKNNDDITLQIDTHPLFYAHRPLIITQKIDADLVTIDIVPTMTFSNNPFDS